MKQRVLPVLKRFFALLLCWFFTMNALTAWAQTVTNVPYLAYNTGNGTFESLTATSAEAVTASTTTMGAANTETWYVVNSDVTVSTGISINVLGTVNLILADGATLTTSQRLHVPDGDTLRIYAQSDVTGIMGKLYVTNGGIGANASEGGGSTIVIHGGEISATGGGYHAAGIGGGNGCNGGTITIHGGMVTANGGLLSAGIGGGMNGKSGNITITGGTVTAIHGANSAGIGGGHDGGANTISITGGTVTAYGNPGDSGNAQAIGRGSKGDAGTLLLGNVKVYNSATATTPVLAGSRVATCRTNTARLESCTEHTWENGTCKYCGATTCHVTYDANNATSGTAPTDAKDYISYDIVTVLGNTGSLSRTGYTFDGWNTQADGNGTDYTPGTTFNISSSVTLYAKWAENVMTLAADADNNAAITTANGLMYDVTLDGYTLYRDGSWNTLTVPFNLSDFTGTPLEGATVKTLASSNYSDGTLTLNFSNDPTAIEAGKPYSVQWGDLIIRSTEDWNAFAASVNGGNDYAGKLVILAADITISNMVGAGTVDNNNASASYTNPFRGTFDGCGHILTFNISIASNGSNGTAPFRFIDGATIKNLTIGGSNTSARRENAGLVAYSFGSVTISNCVVSATITNNVSDSKWGSNSSCGGIIANVRGGRVTFNNCLFSGKILGSAINMGGFVGWRNGSPTLVFNNCLFNPIQLRSNNDCRTFYRGGDGVNVTMNNTFYKMTFGGVQNATSTAETGSSLQSQLGDGWEVNSSNVVLPKKNAVLVNPVFTNVNISNSPITDVTTTNASFIGNYAPFNDDNLLFDAYNPNGYALHAALSVQDPTTPPVGYDSFAGWYTDATLEDTVTTIPFANDGNVTLYSKWTPITYTVRFHKNDGGEDEYTDQTLTYDALQALDVNTFIRTGYLFLGWSTTSTGTVVYTDGQEEVFNLTTTKDNVVDLYAVWAEPGSEINPYLIKTNHALQAFCYRLNSGAKFYYNVNDDYTFYEFCNGCVDTVPAHGAGKYFKLDNDLFYNTGDVAGCEGVMASGWTPWQLTGTFTGNFDGDNHVISGLYIDGPGFFSSVDGAVTIKNLGIVNAYINGSSKVGGIVGDLTSATVENCFFEGCISASGNDCGGIVGYLRGLGETVQNCYATGHINGNGNNLGGIVGESASGTSTVSNCYSSMILQGGLNSSNIGGVVGYATNSTVADCYFDKQMSSLPNATGATGLLTSELCAATLPTGLETAFTYQSGFYPVLNGFDFTNPAVKLAFLPFTLQGNDSLTGVAHDFTLPAMTDLVWSKDDLWPNAVTFDNTVTPNTVTLNQQGSVRFTGTLSGRTRYYDIVPYKAPFVGSEANPFTIDNLSDLQNFRDGINTGSDFLYKRFVVNYALRDTIHWLQTANIDMASVDNWTPVGQSTAVCFKGIYNGDGHQLQNLKMAPTASGDTDPAYKKYRAFFLYPNGTIKNVHIVNPQLTGWMHHAASLATFVMGGTIDNCSVSGGSFAFLGSNCAGLVGFVGDPTTSPFTRASNVTISNCHNDCSISISVDGHVGGVIGRVYAENCTVTRCYNTGNITSTYTPASNPSDPTYNPKNQFASFGGVVGICENDVNPNSCTITFCYNTGDITAKYGLIGGVLGQAFSSHHVAQSFNTGNITGKQCHDFESFGVGGVVAPYLATAEYCFNTGKVTVDSNNYNIEITANGMAGVAGVNSNCDHCFNVGQVTNGNISHSSVGGVASNIASHSFNANRVIDRNHFTPHPHSIAPNVETSFTDKQMAINAQDGTLCTTSQLIGETSIAKSTLGEDYWIYEAGRYPRLAWTDSCDWARDIAIAACSPVLLPNEDDDIDHVKPGVQFGCANNVKWGAPDGNCLFANNLSSYACVGNVITPVLGDNCTTPVEVSDSVNGKVVKTLSLLRHLGATADTLTVDNLDELKALRDGVNSDAAFTYKEKLLPRFAEGVVFKLTADITLPDADWAPIGSGNPNMRFAGTFLGNKHTISNLNVKNQAVAGLFGYLTGEVRDLKVEVDTIANATYAGAVCGAMDNGKIANCTTLGGEIFGAAYTVATDHYGTGGIAGVSLGNDTVINCTNFANITTGYCGAGILADGGHVLNSANAGTITGLSDCAYTGGIGGKNTTAVSCFNSGMVTAEPGNSTAYNYVGGIVANNDDVHAVQYCYNAGIVDGGNRLFTGGICGDGKPQYCYNSNTVRSTGAYLGSIVGNYAEHVDSCYYDMQLTDSKGMSGSDQEKMAEGRLTHNATGTNGMIGSDLQLLLGDESYWTYNTDELYPRLAHYTANPSLAYASVMPVIFHYDGETNDYDTYNSVSHDFKMNGCGTGDWRILSGQCVTLDANDHCQATVLPGMMGIVELGAYVHDTLFCKMRLVVNISEENPLIIKDLTELKNFRDVINNGMGYYNVTQSTYQLVLSSEDSTNLSNFVEITDGGRDLYFKLTTDVNLSSVGDWTPVGNYSADHPEKVFKGHFNGAGHTITGLQLASADYQGFFGYISAGTVKNLTFQNAALSGAGDYRGVVCGYNFGGEIQNCQVMNSSMNTMAGDTVGMVCGSNQYGRILRCVSQHNEITLNNGKIIGGICGYNAFGTIDSCTSKELVVLGVSQYMGGIVGYNYRGQILNDTIQKSFIGRIGNPVTGEFIGGIVGYTGGKYLYDYANHAVVENCVSDTTVIFMNNSGSHVGGIAGMAAEQYNYLLNCRTAGGSVRAKGHDVGGIVGEFYYYNENSWIRNCFNFSEVRGITKVGGIAGILNNGVIDSCGNYGKVYADTLVGGIAGDCTEYGYITNSFNTEVIAATTDCAGGIAGRMHSVTDAAACYVHTSFNSGMVKGRNQVGGIVGRMFKSNYFNNCYNTGVVKGIAQVGGIAGEIEDPTVVSGNSYSAGWVEAASMAGAVCGFTSDATRLENCHYDLQMAVYKGVNENDETNVSSHLTSGMTGTALTSSLTDECWKFKEGLYPRFAFADMAAGAYSALPLSFDQHTKLVFTAADLGTNTNTYYTLPGCDTVTWVKVSGGGGVIDAAHCTLSPDGTRNMMLIAAVKDGDTLRYVKLSFGISEANPIVILTDNDLVDLRNLINSGTPFFYDDVNHHFYATDGGSFIPIPAYGDGYYFQLKDDNDIVLDGWVPMGSSDAPFRGYFDGNNKKAKLRIVEPGNSMRGLFGSMQGRVKDLRILVSDSIKGLNDIGAIAGYCHGTVESCSVGYTCEDFGGISGHNYVGGLVGRAFYSQILDCYNGSNVTGDSCVGGIVGVLIADDPAGETDSYAGALSRCFNYGIITATGSDSKVGGLAGATVTEVSHSYNTGIVNGVSQVGGAVGWCHTSRMQYCYNAGFVNAGTQYVGAITSGDNGSYRPQNCYYDQQNCPLDGGIGLASNAINSAGQSTALLTVEIVGNGIKPVFGETMWAYNINEYPRLASFATTSASTASVTPILLPDRMPVNNIVQDFQALDNGSDWSRYGTASPHAVNEPLHAVVDPPVDFYDVGLITCGPDSLMVKKDCERRIVPLVINATGAKMTRDTACASYTWAPTSTHTEVHDKTGFYTYRESGGCGKVHALDLVIMPEIEISISKHDACDHNCALKNNGEITVTVESGGFGEGFDYVWTKEGDASFTSTDTHLKNLSAGTYQLTVTDKTAFGNPKQHCSISENVVIEELPFINYSVSNDANCVDTDDGIIVTTLHGGTTPFTLTFTYPTSETVTHTVTNLNEPDTLKNLANGVYSMTITDANGCYVNIDHNVTTLLDDNHPTLTLSAYGLKKVYDGIPVNADTFYVKAEWPGGTTTTDKLPSGSDWNCVSWYGADILHATVSAGQGLVHVDSVPNLLTYTITSTSGEDVACRYRVTVKDSSVVITCAPLSITSLVDTQYCYNSTAKALTTTATGGDGSYTYQWQMSSDNGSTWKNVGTNASNYTPSTTPAGIFKYKVTVTSGSECGNEESEATVTVYNDFNVAETMPDANYCKDETADILSVSVAGSGSYSYQWYAGTTPIAAPRGTAATLTPGTSNYNTDTTYSVKVTDNTCPANTTVEVSKVHVWPSFNVTETMPDANYCKDATAATLSVSVTGSGNYSYQWYANGTEIAAPRGTASTLTPGTTNYNTDTTYSVKVTDNTCPANTTVEVSKVHVWPELAFSGDPTVTNVTCHSASTGSITVTVTGGTPNYSYKHNDGEWTTASTETSHTFNDRPAGDYTVSVKDGCNATATTATITVTEPAELAMTKGDSTDIACHGQSTGTAQVHVTGGSTAAKPYKYQLDGMAESPFTSNADSTFTGLSAGTHTIKVTDNCGVSKTVVFNLKQPDNLAMTNDAPVEILCHNGKGSVTVHVTGGTHPYVYSLDGGAYGGADVVDSTFANLAAGTHTIAVKDGCDSIRSFTYNFTEPVNLAMTAGTPVEIQCHGGTGSVMVHVTGGTRPYVYSLDGGTYGGANVADSTFANLPAGSHTITVKDACDSVRSYTHTFTEPANLVITNETPDEILCHGGKGSVRVHVTGGTRPYKYSLDGGAYGGADVTDSTFANLAAGTHTIRVKDDCDSVRSYTHNFTEPANLAMTNETPVEIQCHGGTGSVKVHVTGGTRPYVYSLDGGTYGGANVADSTFANLTAGTHTISVKDACDSVRSFTYNFTEPNEFTVSNITTHADTSYCFGATADNITVSATNGTAPYSYTWYGNGVIITGATNAYHTPSTTTIGSDSTYYVIVKDACGATVTVNPVAHVKVCPLPTVNTASIFRSRVACMTDTTAAVSDTNALASLGFHFSQGHNISKNVSVVSNTFTGDNCFGTRTTIYRATDECGNSVDVTYIQTVKDSLPPTFTVPAPASVCRNADNSYTITTAVTGNVTDAADNCSTPVVSYSDAAPVSNADGTLTILRTWKATDGCNTTEKVQTITVNPLPTLEITDAATTQNQTIFFGTDIAPVVFTNTYSTVSISPVPGSASWPAGFNYDVPTQTLTSNLPAFGTYTFTATATSLYGCDPVSKTVNITVKSDPTPIVITSSTKSWTYNSANHKDEVYTVTYGGVSLSADASGKVFELPTGDKVTITATAAGVTNVSDNAPENNTYNYAIENPTQYTNVTALTGTLSILCKQVTITAKDASKTYDGTPLTESGFTATALETGDSHTFAVTMTSASTITTFGTTPNVIATVDGTPVTPDVETPVGNYCVTAKNGTLSIGKRPFTITLDSVKVYDGAPFMVTASQLYVTGLVNNDTLASGEMWTESGEVGEYENNDGSFQATLASGIIYKGGFSILDPSGSSVTSCYTPTFKVKLGIVPCTITITAATDSKPYDGTPLTNSGYSITAGALVSSDNLASCIVTGSQLCLGSSPNVPSGAVIKNGTNDVTGNYTIHYVNGTLTVTQATGFSCPPAETFYLDDCAANMTVTLTGTPTVTGVAAGHYTVTNNLASLNPMGVGTHTVKWSLLDDCGNVAATCDQTVKVDYKPCVGVTWQGHFYDAVRVGSQCWLAENIRWATGNHAVYKEESANLDKFGYLYSWYTAVGVDEDDDSAIPTTKSDTCGEPYVQGICPDGWGVGSEADFSLLNATAGSTGALKEMSTLYWLSGYEGTLPNTGFNARGGGWYNSSLARYEDLMTGAHFWRCDATPGSAAFSSVIAYYCDETLSTQSRKTDKMSVRCIRKVMP